MDINYYLTQIREGWRHPGWWRELLYSRLLGFLTGDSSSKTYVLQEDWDNLIILDACRYDIFEEELQNWRIEGELDSRRSPGPATVSFLQENFGNEQPSSEMDDIVYVTANPYVNTVIGDKFYRTVPVWDFGWDEQTETVLPEQMYRSTLQAKNEHPDHRLIAHFIQPHEPFIRLDQTTSDPVGQIRAEAQSDGAGLGFNPSAWRDVKRGRMSPGRMIWGYIENLKITMPYVVQLARRLPGKTVITSDHGEAMGEKAHWLFPIHVYGHGKQANIESLLKVPWYECEPVSGTDALEKALIHMGIQEAVTNRDL